MPKILSDNMCKEVLSLQPMIPPKHFNISPPDWGMLRRSRCVQIMLQQNGDGSIDSRGSRSVLYTVKRVDRLISAVRKKENLQSCAL